MEAFTLNLDCDNKLFPHFQTSNSTNISFQPQTRDFAVLKHLLELKYMTTRQLARAFWKRGTGKDNREAVCRRRLLTLYEFGLVARIRPRAKMGNGSIPVIWTITERGMTFLSNEPKIKNIYPTKIEIQESLMISEKVGSCIESGGTWNQKQILWPSGEVWNIEPYTNQSIEILSELVAADGGKTVIVGHIKSIITILYSIARTKLNDSIYFIIVPDEPESYQVKLRRASEVLRPKIVKN